MYKKCPHCGETKLVSEFYRSSSTKSGYQYWCKTCSNERNRRWRSENSDHVRALNNASRYRRGIHKPLGTNPYCSSYLGVFVAERVLAHVFDHVEKMPYGNPGFDFRCGRGCKIDVKSACRLTRLCHSDSWPFAIRKNANADYFLLIAFSDRENLEPEHVWLVPGELVNDKFGVSISDSRLDKWSKYELDDKLAQVIACCDSIRCGSHA